MKYVKFLSLPLAVFLAACSDPLPKCGDAEVVGALKELQEKDAKKYWKDSKRRGTAAWQHFIQFASEKLEKEIMGGSDFEDEKEWTIEKGEVEKPLEYSGFVTESQDKKSKILQCSAVANGEIAVSGERKIVFKNFHASYELKLLDNGEDFYLRLFTDLLSASD